jgi:hypothetical protein
MVNEDLVGGIEVGISKGQSIEAITTGFFNAGYSKEDIDWALKSFDISKFSPTALNFPLKQENPPFQESSSEEFVKKPYISQHVSGYEQASGFKEKAILIIFISLLFILLGTLAAVFFFKTQLANFINNLFG